MELILVRHAIAEDRSKWSGDDDARPLTKEGRVRMEQVSAGLRRLLPYFDAIYSSPLTRARQTAEILMDSYKMGLDRLKLSEGLRPEADPKSFLSTLDYSLNRVVVVGHEPHLGDLAGLIVGSSRALPFKKGGVGCFEISSPPHGTLVWFLPPKLLRGIA